MARRRQAPARRWTWGGVVTVLVPLCTLALVLLGYGYTLAVQSVFGIDAALVADSLPDYLRLSAHVFVHFVAGVSEASQRWDTYERLYLDMWPQLLIGVTAWVMFFVVWLPRTWWALRFASLNAAGQRVASACRIWEAPPWLGPVRSGLGGVLSFVATLLRCLARAPRAVWWACGSLLLIVGWPLLSLALAVLAVMLVGFVFSLLPGIGYEIGRSSLQQWVVEPLECVSVRSRDQRLVESLRLPEGTRNVAGVECVCLEKDGKEIARGRLVASTADAVILFDPMSGVVQRIPVGDAQVRAIQTLAPVAAMSGESL